MYNVITISAAIKLHPKPEVLAPAARQALFQLVGQPCAFAWAPVDPEILAAVARDEQPGLILAGKQAIDNDLNATGQMLAALHKAAENYPAVQGRSAQQLISNQDLLLSDDIAQAIRQRIRNSPALSAYFADQELDQTWLSQLAHVHEKVKTAMQRAPKIWTHNDLHASNLLWSENSDQAEISTVIDFGLSDRNSAIYDLAVTVERNFIDWLALNQTQDIHIDEAGLQAFIQAYAQHSHSLDELAILPELIKIVHTDFAVSELEYFAGITRNFKHADAAYHDWLIAHTAWFFKPQGQQFCQKLALLIQQAAA